MVPYNPRGSNSNLSANQGYGSTSTGNTKTNPHTASQHGGPKADGLSAEAAQGLAITEEQIRDVYNAGTSDGILILEGGIVVNLNED